MGSLSRRFERPQKLSCRYNCNLVLSVATEALFNNSHTTNPVSSEPTPLASRKLLMFPHWARWYFFGAAYQ